jgi:hypothetical protein
MVRHRSTILDEEIAFIESDPTRLLSRLQTLFAFSPNCRRLLSAQRRVPAGIRRLQHAGGIRELPKLRRELIGNVAEFEVYFAVIHYR